MRLAENHITEYTKDGKQTPNLPRRLQSALADVLELVQDGELVPLKTDKTGNWVISDYDSYIKMCSTHTTKDKQVSTSKLLEVCKLHDQHTSMWIKMFAVGDNWG